MAELPISATRPLHAGCAEWPPEPLGQLLADARHDAAGKLALADGGRRLTYAELGAQVDRACARLAALGARAGAAVVLMVPNWWETVVLAHAVWALGGVANPVVPIYREHELGFILAEARPSLLVVAHRHRGFDYVRMLEGMRGAGTLPEDLPVLVVRPEGALPEGFFAWDDIHTAGPQKPPPVASPRREDVALLLYTSGTTGTAKGVLQTHGSLLYEVDSIIALARLGARDHVFMPSPLTHVTGLLYGVILPVRLRVPCTLLDRWDPEVAAVLTRDAGCTFTVAASPFLHGLALAHERLGAPSPLQVFICGGADVPPELVRRARRCMGTRVVRAYGSSELPTFCGGDPFGDPEQAAATDGRPIGSAEGRLLDAQDGVGELLIRGPDMFVGYLDAAANASAFTPDGFFRTGDLASIDQAGAITIRGRLKDIINRGGEKLSAAEIESVLFEHRAVQQVAVVAAPDAILGERPFAFVVPAAGAAFTLEDARQHLKSRGLARQKWPEGLAIVEDLPRTPSGKVKKFELRERLRTAAASGRHP